MTEKCGKTQSNNASTSDPKTTNIPDSKLGISEKNENKEILTWNPNFDEEILDKLLTKFQIHPMLSVYHKQRESVYGFDKIVVAPETPANGNLHDDIISKEEMLNVIYECNFDEETIERNLKERGVKGWNERYHSMPLWDLNSVQRFETGMSLYYKQFHKIQELIPQKSTKEIIEFYYFWKQMPRYKEWKQIFKESIVRPSTVTSTQYMKVKDDLETDEFLKTDPLLELNFLDSSYPLGSSAFETDQALKKRKVNEGGQVRDYIDIFVDAESVSLNAY